MSTTSTTSTTSTPSTPLSLPPSNVASITPSTSGLAQRTFGFRVAHAAVRRDVARLERAVPRVATPEDAAAIAVWFERFAEVLTHHHEIEDEIWWPVLVTAFGDFGRQAMIDDHRQLVADLGSASIALAELASVAAPQRPAARRRAAAAVTVLARTTTAHLDAEEAAVFPLLATVAGEVVADAERRSAKRDSLALTRFALPWALDGAEPALAAEIRSAIPALMRLVVARWDRRYRRQYARFLALAA